jgi:hypothetical protein
LPQIGHFWEEIRGKSGDFAAPQYFKRLGLAVGFTPRFTGAY